MNARTYNYLLLQITMIGFGTKPDTPKDILDVAVDIGYTFIEINGNKDKVNA